MGSFGLRLLFAVALVMLASCKRSGTAPRTGSGGVASASSTESPATQPPSSADAAVLLEPLEGPWIRELPLSDGRKTFVAVPAGAREPLPVLVAVHGAGDRADWACSEWTAILAGTAIVVCPQGRASQWQGTFAWGSAQHIAENADAALEAVRAKFGAHVGPWPPVYAAWSQAGTLAGQVMALRPKLYRRVVISEVGHTALDPKATAVAMGGASVERVVVSCSTAPCRTWAQAFEREAGKVEPKLAVRTNDAGTRGHVFDEPVFKTLAPKVLWLVDGDEGWAGVRAGMEGKWGKP